MKVGDQVPLSLEGHHIGYATIVEVLSDRATLSVPALTVVMGISSSLTDIDPEVDRVLSNDVDVRSSESARAVEEEKSSGIRPEDISNEGLHGRELDSSAID